MCIVSLSVEAVSVLLSRAVGGAADLAKTRLHRRRALGQSSIQTHSRHSVSYRVPLLPQPPRLQITSNPLGLLAGPAVAGSGGSRLSAMEPSESPDGGVDVVKRIRIHKVRGRSAGEPDTKQQASGGLRERMEMRIAEIIPGIAELPVSGQGLAGRDTARDIVSARLQREQQHAEELRELQDIYDMRKHNPVEDAQPEGPWTQRMRPRPRRIVLSPYQYEMINYQRMLMRNNIWYYRDRMSVPRGPCPLHVLKDCWTQGVIDENTLLWGHGLYDWLPAKNIKLLVPMIRTPEGERQHVVCCDGEVPCAVCSSCCDNVPCAACVL